MFGTVRRIFHMAGGWSAWPKPLLLSARGVIRFLLERNISYRCSRCVDSLIRGDKYRRDTSPKQTARAEDRWRRSSETRKWDKRIGEGRRATRDRRGSILAFGGPHSRERHPSLPRGVRGVIVCRAPANPARPFRLTPNQILTSGSH